MCPAAAAWNRGWTLGRVTGIMHLLSSSNFLSTDDNRNKGGKKKSPETNK